MRRTLRIHISLAFLAALCCAMNCSSQDAAANSGLFLMLSDIHLDPFADPSIACKLATSPVEQWTAIFESSTKTPFSSYGADTTYPLFASALAAAKNGKYDHVIISGDFLRHNFQTAFQQAITGCSTQDYNSFVIKTMQFMTRRIRETLPDTPVISALGNNDSTCGDYAIYPADPLLPALAKEWIDGAKYPDADKSFRAGGYYAIPHPTVATQEMVVLNNIFWSHHYAGCAQASSNVTQPGASELGWLESTLRRLKREKKSAILIMHIPPGFDPYGSSKAQCPAVASPNLNQSAGPFLALLERYKDVIVDMYAGHTHMDDFRVASVAMHITPGLTPDFGNNPGFDVGTYNKKDGRLSNFTTIYLTNLAAVAANSTSVQPIWQTEYDFTKAYGLPFTSANLGQLAGQIATDSKVRGLFGGYYAVSAPSPINEKNWIYYSCDHTQMTAAGYNNCVCGKQ